MSCIHSQNLQHRNQYVVQKVWTKRVVFGALVSLISLWSGMVSTAQDQHAHAKKKPSQFTSQAEFPVDDQVDLPDPPSDSAAAPEVNAAALPESEPVQESILPGNAAPGIAVPTPELFQPDGRNDWFSHIEVGYDRGFVIASKKAVDLNADDDPFSLKINGWGQLRIANFESETDVRDQRQIQLQRGRLVFSGSAFTSDFSYFLQFDGRSSSGDDIRLLDYFLWYDLGHHSWGKDPGVIGFKIGRYKMPFSLARYLTAREFEFSDRSVASTFFDVNRSLAWGLAGRFERGRIPIHWEAAVFNGLVTGGAETGSSGDLDNNFAVSGRAFCYPTGDWGTSELADFEYHCRPATRLGLGYANTTNDRIGRTEFQSTRVVDTGDLLSSLLPPSALQYEVSLYAVDASVKYRGWSSTLEYYFRNISDIEGARVPDLFDHGFWFQISKFVVPEKLQLTSRWSRVVGNSGTQGGLNESSDEIAGGFVYHFRGQNAKLTVDATHINGAPIDSSALGLSPRDTGWLLRTQFQFAF